MIAYQELLIEYDYEWSIGSQGQLSVGIVVQKNSIRPLTCKHWDDGTDDSWWVEALDHDEHTNTKHQNWIPGK